MTGSFVALMYRQNDDLTNLLNLDIGKIQNGHENKYETLDQGNADRCFSSALTLALNRRAQTLVVHLKKTKRRMPSPQQVMNYLTYKPR